MIAMHRPYPFIITILLVTVISLSLTSPVLAPPPSFPKLIFNPTSITAGVSSTFTITFSVRDIPSGYGLTRVGIILLWPSSDMESVSGTEGASLPPGWTVDWIKPTSMPPGSEGKFFSMVIDTGEHVTVDREWLTVTFHCLRPGPSAINVDGFLTVQELPEGEESTDILDDIDVTVNQFLPVGGVTTPVNKIGVLTTYLALPGLIAVVSVVYVIKRRKA